MGVINSNKTVSLSEIKCGESFDVTLAFSAAPDIMGVAADIVLALDKSTSMLGDPFEELKKGAMSFLDTIDYESDGKRDGLIGNRNRVGLISFSSAAKIEQPLSNSATQIKGKINNMRAGGGTNHEDAFRKAIDIFNNSTSGNKILIMFTDGVSNEGSEGYALAEQLKAQGISVFCIGYGPNAKENEEVLHRYASSPSESFVMITPDLSEIQGMFENFVRNELKQGAIGVKIEDVISDCFEITKIVETSNGVSAITGPNSIRWEVDRLGDHVTEGAKCTFTVRHKGVCSGVLPVNESISYTDNQNNTVSFPSPTVKVDCEGGISIIEECPAKQDILISGCVDSVAYIADDVSISGLGRVVQIDVKVKNVCPDKRVGLAVVLYETDGAGIEQMRGMKTFLIPKQNTVQCTDVSVRCIKFVLPQELDMKGRVDSLCNDRNFRVMAFANYIDTDFRCCN